MAWTFARRPDPRRAVPSFVLAALSLATVVRTAKCGPVPSIPVPPMAPPPDTRTNGWEHNWDCVMCSSNSMLSANFGTGSSHHFNFSDHWWIKEVAHSYAHVLLSDFFVSGGYNGTGSECALVSVARALKKENPNIIARC